jgi:hypothetical protein
MIGNPEDCRKQAAKCREFALSAPGPIARDAYLHLAAKWDELADEIIRTQHVIMAINGQSPRGPKQPGAGALSCGQSHDP